MHIQEKGRLPGRHVRERRILSLFLSRSHRSHSLTLRKDKPGTVIVNYRPPYAQRAVLECSDPFILTPALAMQREWATNEEQRKEQRNVRHPAGLSSRPIYRHANPFACHSKRRTMTTNCYESRIKAKKIQKWNKAKAHPEHLSTIVYISVRTTPTSIVHIILYIRRKICA